MRLSILEMLIKTEYDDKKGRFSRDSEAVKNLKEFCVTLKSSRSSERSDQLYLAQKSYFPIFKFFSTGKTQEDSASYALLLKIFEKMIPESTLREANLTAKEAAKALETLYQSKLLHPKPASVTFECLLACHQLPDTAWALKLMRLSNIIPRWYRDAGFDGNEDSNQAHKRFDFFNRTNMKTFARSLYHLYVKGILNHGNFEMLSADNKPAYTSVPFYLAEARILNQANFDEVYRGISPEGSALLIKALHSVGRLNQANFDAHMTGDKCDVLRIGLLKLNTRGLLTAASFDAFNSDPNPGDLADSLTQLLDRFELHKLKLPTALFDILFKARLFTETNILGLVNPNTQWLLTPAAIDSLWRPIPTDSLTQEFFDKLELRARLPRISNAIPHAIIESVTELVNSVLPKDQNIKVNYELAHAHLDQKPRHDTLVRGPGRNGLLASAPVEREASDDQHERKVPDVEAAPEDAVINGARTGMK